nr:hypothetical protein [uncultured Anaeromusa sp.]
MALKRSAICMVDIPSSAVSWKISRITSASDISQPVILFSLTSRKPPSLT